MFSSDVRLVPAAFKHINRIANRMREIDAEECRAMGHSPKQALRNGVMLSNKAWTALVDGQPEAMFGVVVENALTGDAVPWFLGTDEVYRHGRELLMWGPGMIDRLRDPRRNLKNYVSLANRKAIRMLKWWGFCVSSEALFFGGVEFRQFQMLRDAKSCRDEFDTLARS